MKKIIAFLILTGSNSISSAQDPGALLNLWSKRSPVEKVYLHLDRDNYASGETIWFKAYLASENLPDTGSTVLYVELLNSKPSLISRSVLPIILGNTNGHIILPDTLTSGAYLIRAYSPTMLNQKAEFIYTRHIRVHGKKAETGLAKQASVRLQFFPEGGNFVAGVNNSLAFKAVNEKGLPVDVKGTIRNSKNENITTFSSYHDGMGIIEFIPARGEQYHAQVENGTGGRYDLPALTENAIAVTIIPHPSGYFFDVRQQAADPSRRVSFMLGQMQHRVVFRQDYKQQPDALEGVIDTRNLPSGIMHVTFFNKQGLPLAERMCFVNNGEFVQQATLTTDTLNFNARSKNRFSIRMKDTVQGSFSISVVDADYSGSSVHEEHIASRLLLQADLPGYIHKPGYYFSAKNDSVTTAADLLMMTHGWRRFKWSELEELTTRPLPYADPGFITLKGKVKLRNSNKPLAEKLVMVYISAGDTARKIETVRTDKQGNYRLDSLVFFGKSKVLYNDGSGKQSMYIDVDAGPDTLTRNYPGLPSPSAPAHLTGSMADAEWKKIYDEILKENGLLLEGITLKTRKKSPLKQVEDEYTRGAFSGEARQSFDLVNSDDGEHYQSVYQYLEAKGVLAFNRNLPQASSMGSFNTIYYLDELPADLDLHLLPLNQVALIKVFTSFVGEWGNAPGGVIAIYSKKGENIRQGSMKGAVVSYPGFSIVKEFYAPDYRMPAEAGTADNRLTIDWRPDVYINNINPQIPFSFYNNDRTKRFRVIVQGMTATGKMVFLDQLIGPSSKGF